MTNCSSHLIDKVEGKRCSGVKAEDLDVGVGRQHRRVEADDVCKTGDQDAHLEILSGEKINSNKYFNVRLTPASDMVSPSLSSTLAFLSDRCHEFRITKALSRPAEDIKFDYGIMYTYKTFIF